MCVCVNENNNKQQQTTTNNRKEKSHLSEAVEEIVLDVSNERLLPVLFSGGGDGWEKN